MRWDLFIEFLSCSYPHSRATSNAQRIVKWIVLPVDFSLPGGELGPTLKMKRHVVHEKNNQVIEDFYKS